MNKRFFSFGCSFTKWCWPTWNDYIGINFDAYINKGSSGADNKNILYNLLQVDKEYKLNEMVYNAQYRFSPVIGEVYHLYQRGDGSSFLSMIDPKQWQTVDDRYRKDFDFVGSFKLTSNNKWEKL